MEKKKKIIIAIVAVVVVLGVGIAGFCLNRANTNSNQKSFTIVVQSERDGLNETIQCKSDLGTVGEYVRTMEQCSWEDSEYGTFITGWFGCEQNMDEQYWWSFSVNNEMSANGVDLVALEDGQEYEFILVQGW